MENLKDSDWRSLIRIILKRNCILVLGPDAAVDPNDPEGDPLHIKLARHLAEELDDDQQLGRQDDLAHIAQVYQSRHDRVDLEIAVEDFYQTYENSTTEFHQQIANLPFTVCINTTHDNLLANAFDAHPAKEAVRDFYWFRKHKPVKPVTITPEHPLVYSLLGSPTEGDSLVLTESDLLDFLVNIVKNTPPLPAHLTSRLCNHDSSFLFLGFGFQRWYIRILLHVLKTHTPRNRSLALEEAHFFDHPDKPQTVIFYDLAHRLQFRQESWEVFAKRLNDSFAGVSQRQDVGPVPGLADDKPTVFLCHCSENADSVAEINEKLQTLGVCTWLDRQNLRGGDRWHQILDRVINDWVNYVVVLETPAMLGRTESYYYREINVALDREKQQKRGFKFIFPAQLAPCDRLEELAHIQHVELTKPDGCERLAADILDDWLRRCQHESAAP